MAMAALQARAKMGPAVTSCVCFVLLIIAVTTMNGPATVMAHEHEYGLPSNLTLYIHENSVAPNETEIVAASPSAANGGDPFAFGTIVIMFNEVKADEHHSPLLGYAVGQIVVGLDLSAWLVFTYKLNTPELNGTISVQGATDQEGNGELAITGGTGLFRWAKGYVELSFFSDEDPMHIIYKSVLYLKYD